jgi:hypothetical protein
MPSVTSEEDLRVLKEAPSFRKNVKRSIAEALEVDDDDVRITTINVVTTRRLTVADAKKVNKVKKDIDNLKVLHVDRSGRDLSASTSASQRQLQTSASLDVQYEVVYRGLLLADVAAEAQAAAQTMNESAADSSSNNFTSVLVTTLVREIANNTQLAAEVTAVAQTLGLTASVSSITTLQNNIRSGSVTASDITVEAATASVENTTPIPA